VLRSFIVSLLGSDSAMTAFVVFALCRTR